MSGRKPRLIGWGYEGEETTPEEARMVTQRFRDQFGSHLGSGEPRVVVPPTVEQISLHASRLGVPRELADFATAAKDDRLRHTYGKSFPDYVRAFAGDFSNAPDLVAYPRSEEEVERALAWADGARVAVIPFGGGSSVVSGVEPDVGEGFEGSLSLDMTALDQVLEVDDVSRAALVQAGVRVPHLEAQLKPTGFTLRHYPQSFEMATLGGMIATRSGGHFATLYTHIDDFVEGLRTVTPRGTMESFRLPGSGAGPSPDRLLIGSEGALGVITQAWMRLQSRPVFRAGTSVLFPAFRDAVEAVRVICQAGLYPANVRLLDPGEAANNGFGDGTQTVVVLAFENSDHPVDAWMDRALEIAGDYGGCFDFGAAKSGSGHLAGTAGAWRNAFIRMPYFKTLTVGLGLVSDTFETSITWERFHGFHDVIKRETEAAIVEATGRAGTVTCRFTHCYPDGPAPYFTFQGLGSHGELEAQWRHIKGRALDAVVAGGGTVTHHHAVGRDHMRWYERQRPGLFAEALQGAKARLDPNGILNPGVLLACRGATS